MLYYKNRREAGKILAQQLKPKVDEKTVLIALGDGSIPVCQAIAEHIPALITLLVTEAICLPGEEANPIGYIDQDGTFVPNKLMSDGERDELYREYLTYIEQEKREKFHKTIALSGGKEIFPHKKLHDYNVVMVSDGFSSGPLLDSIVELLKPIRIKQFSIATPVACITTVDRMNRYSNDVHALGIADFYLGANHYYDDNKDIPTHEEAVAIVNNSIASWQF